MNHAEAALLLGQIAAFDRRTVGDADVLAWQAALHDVSLADSRSAVVDHYRGSSEWLTPARVIAGVKAIRRQRLEHADRILPAADPDDPAAYIAQLRAGRAALASGRIEPPELLPARPMIEQRRGMAPLSRGVAETAEHMRASS